MHSCIQAITFMTVDLCMAYICAHACVDDLELVARSQWLGVDLLGADLLGVTEKALI